MASANPLTTIVEIENRADNVEESPPSPTIKRRGRGPARKWELIHEAENYEAAIDFMNIHHSDYKFRQSQKSSSGQKMNYYCEGFLKCPNVMQIVV